MTDQAAADLAHAGVFQLRGSGMLKLRAESLRPRCTVDRDLFAGTPEAGTVILSCELQHHTDNWAHRMTNPDGSVTTWRS
jgi:hypothetical protein